MKEELTDDKLEKMLQEYFKSQSNDIPQLDEERLEYLKRCCARNTKKFNLQQDKFYLNDMIKSVEYGIKPLTLSNSQIKQLEKQFQIQ